MKNVGRNLDDYELSGMYCTYVMNIYGDSYGLVWGLTRVMEWAGAGVHPEPVEEAAVGAPLHAHQPDHGLGDHSEHVGLPDPGPACGEPTCPVVYLGQVAPVWRAVELLSEVPDVARHSVW